MFGDTSTSINWKYVRRLFGTASVVLGAFLLGEHIYRFGFELFDILGHEYLGLALILGGVLLTLRTKPEPEET